MRAFVVAEHAHPTKISLSYDVSEPKAKPDEVLVDVYSASLNYFDILQSQGKYQVQPPLPFVLGAEFAGRISQNSPIPKGCPYQPGDRVFGYAQGAYADKVAAKARALLPLPDNMSYDQGAGLFITCPTSYEALVGRAELKAGEWVLVTASAGGVGLPAVQIAKALGAKVIAAAGSANKIDISKRLGGADYGIDYTKPDWQKEVMKITGGHGVDVIFDPVGMIKDCLKCIAWKGRAIVVGFANGKIEQLPLNLVLLKNVAVASAETRLILQVKEPGHIPSVWQGLLELLSSGGLKPVIYDKVYPLEKLADGLRELEQRKTWGKVAIRVREETTKARL
ncbi:hypothetical protein NLI96_g3564 [Meripilus lineatus]|uniref:Enoyl reductase (ER) domain-containing protein n=1 Tax=Meripilus lineatus TaxID=2056292 RepID=A0AAD5VBD4_9APHY|nr:hypothetical protein NLI96_g3564 [Physisporinus lineatus]